MWWFRPLVTMLPRRDISPDFFPEQEAEPHVGFDHQRGDRCLWGNRRFLAAGRGSRASFHASQIMWQRKRFLFQDFHAQPTQKWWVVKEWNVLPLLTFSWLRRIRMFQSWPFHVMHPSLIEITLVVSRVGRTSSFLLRLFNLKNGGKCYHR